MLKLILAAIRCVGPMYLDCNSACAAPPPPDYSSISAANEKSAELGYQAASDRLNFDKGVYDDAKPYVKQLQESSLKTAQQTLRRTILRMSTTILTLMLTQVTTMLTTTPVAM